MMTHNVFVVGNEEKTIKVQHGDNLFQVLSKEGYMLANSCGGNRTCGKCLVKIKVKDPIPFSASEEKLLKAKNAENGQRLACFIDVTQDIQVYLDNENKEAQIYVGGSVELKEIDPDIKKSSVFLEKPQLEDQRDDMTRLLDTMPGDIKRVSYEVIKKLPFLPKSKSDELSVITWNKEVLDIGLKDDLDDIYGIAVDIGTTTIAAYLMNLKTGKEIDVYSSLNPQKSYGADVITRINHTMQNESGLEELKQLVGAELNNIIQVFIERNSLDKNRIYEMVLVGNTTMLHLLWGVDCKNISSSPFIPAFSSEVMIKSKEIGFDINSEGYIITLPAVSAYVGADTMAALMAASMDEDDNVNLLIDIGTNGEIVLGNKEKMICCSTAAGPAFEGGRITYGVGGVIGAIDHVNFKWNNLYTTIGNEEPIGICGSGLFDCVAELIQYGIVDKTGKMMSKEKLIDKLPLHLLERLIKNEGKNAFVLDENKGIVLTQSDVRELQLAKAAIYAGIEVLIDEMGITSEKINNVYLAGGFGNYLDMNSASYIKLIPEELKEKIVPIGNAAGTGAKMALLSRNKRNTISDVKKKMEYIELSTSITFQNKFIQAINF